MFVKFFRACKIFPTQVFAGICYRKAKKSTAQRMFGLLMVACCLNKTTEF